jgi:hypothetical protein
MRGGPRPEAIWIAGAVGSLAIAPCGGGSEGINVSQKTSRVRRWSSVNRSLVDSSAIASPTCWVTAAE